MTCYARAKGDTPSLMSVGVASRCYFTHVYVSLKSKLCAINLRGFDPSQGNSGNTQFEQSDRV